MKPNIGFSNMSSLEFVCTCFTIAGTLFIFTSWQPTRHIISTPINMNCPDLIIRHSVESNLKTGVKVVDVCAESLQVISSDKTVLF